MLLGMYSRQSHQPHEEAVSIPTPRDDDTRHSHPCWMWTMHTGSGGGEPWVAAGESTSGAWVPCPGVKSLGSSRDNSIPQATFSSHESLGRDPNVGQKNPKVICSPEVTVSNYS